MEGSPAIFYSFRFYLGGPPAKNIFEVLMKSDGFSCAPAMPARPLPGYG